MPLGITVKTGETAGSAGVSIQTGKAFILGLAEWGPFTPTLVKSTAGFVSLFGERVSGTSKLFDAVETYFQLQGAEAYIQRVGKESSAEFAKEELETAGKTKVLVIKSKYKGVYGNEIAISFESEKLTVFVKGEVVEEYKELAKAETLKEKVTASAFITVEEGSNYATGKGEAVKTLAKKSLAGGTNPTATISEALAKEALENLPKTLGPGQVLIPSVTGEPTEEKTHTLMGEHASKNNRVAICDLTDSSSASTLKTGKGTVAAGIAGYMEYHSSSCIIPGTTLGTTRTVAGSAVVAALCAQVAKTENDNQAPAGVNWSLAPFVTGFTNTFSLSNMNLLGENGINAFAERQNKPVLYNFVSALPSSTDKIFWQFSAGRERMKLVWQSEEIAESFLFQTIDGRKQLLGRFAGVLQGMLGREWARNALFGELASEAGKVNVGEPINTATTISEGQLNAELKVRISPFAESVTITIISAPVTESI